MSEEDIDQLPPFPPIVLHIVRPGDNIQTKKPGTKFGGETLEQSAVENSTTTTTTTRTNSTPVIVDNKVEDDHKTVSSPVLNRQAKAKKKKEEEKPKEEEIQLAPYEGPRKRITFQSGTVALQGCRPTMEDTHVTIDKLKFNNENEEENEDGQPKEDEAEGISFYGVYDGHGGRDAAIVVETYLHANFISKQAFREGDIVRALGEAFIETDAKVLEVGEEQGWKNGTTAVVVIVRGMDLFVANVGDSEAVLGRRNKEGEGYKSVLLSEKHIASIPSEKKRIVSQGGTVIFGRVFGDLVVSRAFGDSDYKPPKSACSYISCEPSFKAITLHPEFDHFVIIACDGLWDVFKYQDAVDFVFNLRKEGKTAQEISQSLADEALARRSQDNTTVTVVFFDWQHVDVNE